jgi:hypothetical protein
MPFYEYIVVPAPEKSPRVKGLKGNRRFAYGLQEAMNELAQDGWEYYRAESLPEQERRTFMGGTETVIRNVLVFRREIETEADDAPLQPRMTLSQKDGPRAPVRVVPRDDSDSLERIYAAADTELEEDAQTPIFRRPLVARRKTSGADD